ADVLVAELARELVEAASRVGVAGPAVPVGHELVVDRRLGGDGRLERAVAVVDVVPGDRVDLEIPAGHGYLPLSTPVPAAVGGVGAATGPAVPPETGSVSWVAM